jgi:exodeoxyribonuclease VII large subunit
VQRSLLEAGAQLRMCRERLARAHPGARLGQHAQRLDELELRLRRALAERLRATGTQLEAQALRTAAAAERLRAAWQRHLVAAGSRVELAARALQAVSPLATLERGFAIVARPGGAPLVRRAAELRAGEDIEARLADGIVTARVTGRR